MTLTLIRGLPGSGKSTLAIKLAKQTRSAHFESDMYVESKVPVGSDYQTTVIQPGMLANAHAWCLSMTEIAVRSGMDVVVSNTFTTREEMRPYFELSRKYRIGVNVETCVNDYGSVHCVPDEVIERMRARWED